MLTQMHTFKLTRLLFSISAEWREGEELEFGYV